jgi:hypothetical protein
MDRRPCDEVRAWGVDISPRRDQRLDAVQAATANGLVKNSLIPYRDVGIGAMRQQQRDEFELTFRNSGLQGRTAYLRSSVHVRAVGDQEFGSIEMLPADRIVERRCKRIGIVDVRSCIEGRRNGSDITLLGRVMNGCRLRCQRDQAETYRQEHSRAHQLPPLLLPGINPSPGLHKHLLIFGESNRHAAKTVLA